MSKSRDSRSSLFDNIWGTLSLVQNFYIEFFGTLIPGIIAVAGLFLIAFGLCYYAMPNKDLIKEVLRLTCSTAGGMFIFLALSYVAGAIAYRRSPKTPDTISSHHQWLLTKNGSSPDEVGRLAVSFTQNCAIPSGLFGRLRFWLDREHWILRKAGTSIDYPYPSMRKYLCCRGLQKLADYVPWCEGSGGMHFKKEYQKGVCSKTYINIIKQRLRSSGHTNLILDIVRNECHIRMLCSLWYVLTFIFRVLLLSFFVAAVIAAFNICGKANCDCRQGQPVIHSVMDNRESPVRENSGEVLVSAKCQIKILENRGRCPANPESSGTVLAFSVLIAASLLVFYCRYSIEYGLHYVRTREVVMILENAWIMDNVDYGPHPGIELRSHELMFQDIKDKAFDFKSRHCQCGVCKFWKECYGGV